MDLIRVGRVSSVNETDYTVRVEFQDKEKLVSHDLPIFVSTTSKTKNPEIDLPKVGESVVCIFLPNGAQQGFCLGAFYIQQQRS